MREQGEERQRVVWNRVWYLPFPSYRCQVDRRYAWLRRTLVNYEEECSSIFPTEWGIPERLAMEFCGNTK